MSGELRGDVSPLIINASTATIVIPLFAIGGDRLIDGCGSDGVLGCRLLCHLGLNGMRQKNGHEGYQAAVRPDPKAEIPTRTAEKNSNFSK